MGVIIRCYTGSGRLPVTTGAVSTQANQLDLDHSADLFDSLPSFSQNPPPSCFAPSFAAVKILKRIPRGARDAAGAEFDRCLSSVLVHPDKRSSWSKLFAFAGGCLRQPGSRGGRRHNLTSAVIANIRDFSVSTGDISTVVNDSVAHNGRSKKPQVSIDVSTARRAASRLDEGDVKGAIRQLC